MRWTIIVFREEVWLTIDKMFFKFWWWRIHTRFLTKSFHNLLFGITSRFFELCCYLSIVCLFLKLTSCLLHGEIKRSFGMNFTHVSDQRNSNWDKRVTTTRRTRIRACIGFGNSSKRGQQERQKSFTLFICTDQINVCDDEYYRGGSQFLFLEIA